MTPLHPDWREFFELLLRHEVRFVLVGGLAVGTHAEPRYTEDCDVFVEPSVENGARVRAALLEFGFPRVPSVRSLASAGTTLVLGHKPFRIDILKSISGVTFEAAWASRVVVPLDGLELPVIGRAELLTNKRAAGRDKDLRDVLLIERVAPPKRPKTPAKRKPPRKR